MSSHPNAFTPAELAVLDRCMTAFRATNPYGKVSHQCIDFSVHSADFYAYEEMTQRWPKWDPETGEPYLANVAFIHPTKRQPHLMFKGVCMSPRPTGH